MIGMEMGIFLFLFGRSVLGKQRRRYYMFDSEPLVGFIRSTKTSISILVARHRVVLFG